MFDLIDGLKLTVFGNTRPDGTPEFPAKSCREIQMCFPEAKTGKFFKFDTHGRIKMNFENLALSMLIIILACIHYDMLRMCMRILRARMKMYTVVIKCNFDCLMGTCTDT